MPTNIVISDQQLVLARIREVLRDPDLYDSYNSVTTRCLVRDIKEAMGITLNGTDIPEPDDYVGAAAEILTEATAARAKFAPFNSAHEGYAVIAEELDELWDDVKANRHDEAHMIREAIQVGAMAIRFVADLRAKNTRQVAAS